MPKSERAQLREGLATTQRRSAEVCPCRHLTVKLSGRPEAPDQRRGRTLSPSARGAQPQAGHGSQRLLDRFAKLTPERA